MIFGILIRVAIRLLRKTGVNVPDITKIKRRRNILDDVVDQVMGEDPSNRQSGPRARRAGVMTRGRR
jgi:hypothetical protein